MTSWLAFLECSRCSTHLDADRLQGRCGCGGTLLARYDAGAADVSALRSRPAGMWRYRELLPVRGAPVSLGEAETPLVSLPSVSRRFGVDLLLKDDGPLPGGTFKARGAAAGLSRAVELGAKRIVMPSAGNAGGAWALYAARAGVPITVTMARTAPRANQLEVELCGGFLELVDGSLADAGRRAKEIAADGGGFLASTFSEPYRLEGKKSCFLELYDRLGTISGGPGARMRLPGTIVLPVGGGVAALAAWKAAEEAIALGWAEGEPPVLVGVQPEDCAPIVRAFESGADHVEPWDRPTNSIAAGLRVPSPAEGDLVLETIRRSHGTLVAVSEKAIRRAVGALASTDGVFACPEGAATLAGLEALPDAAALPPPVVLYNTGAGVKYLEELAAPPSDRVG